MKVLLKSPILRNTCFIVEIRIILTLPFIELSGALLQEGVRLFLIHLRAAFI
ncbi:MAG: hypothetical protein WAM95_02305 [Bacillus sp. (in: firmicutes)]